MKIQQAKKKDTLEEDEQGGSIYYIVYEDLL